MYRKESNLDYPIQTYVLITLAALGAGIVNSIAGGGTLLTFPALMSAISGVEANATSTIALMPGSLAGAWGFRHEIKQVRTMLLRLIPPSFLGGWLGSELVIENKNNFEHVFPWLMLLATALFMMQKSIQRWTGTGHVGAPSRKTIFVIIGCQFLIGVYGGYFGAGIGILMLATLGFMGFENIHQMNLAKTILAFVINLITAINFVAAKEPIVVWPLAIPMICAAIVGGYLGARIARSLSKEVVRRVVTCIGLAVTIYFFWNLFSKR
jgi:uncharacterized membrane protein YfcA